MNSITLVGEVSSEPIIRHYKTTAPTCEFILEVPRPNRSSKVLCKRKDYIRIVTYGSVAEYVARCAVTGTRMAIGGSLTGTKREINGHHYIHYAVIGFELIILDSPRDRIPEDTLNRRRLRKDETYILSELLHGYSS